MNQISNPLQIVLFDQHNTRFQNAQKFNEEFLTKNFKKFGEISSVQLINSGKCEGYVTFVDNRSAALAFTFTCCENDRLTKDNRWIEWLVEPANTWHQPLETNLRDDVSAMDIENEEESQSSMMMLLNEDCFRHLFKFCDLKSLINLSEVSRFFNVMLLGADGKDQKHFQHIKSLNIFANELNDDMTLGLARKHLQRVGTVIGKLRVEFYDENRWNLQRYLDKMCQYVGDNIRELEIMCCSGDYLPSLSPILQHLRVLKLNASIRPYHSEIDFQSD